MELMLPIISFFILFYSFFSCRHGMMVLRGVLYPVANPCRVRSPPKHFETFLKYILWLSYLKNVFKMLFCKIETHCNYLSLVYVSTTFSNKSSHIEQIEPNKSNPVYFLALTTNKLLKTIKL